MDIPKFSRKSERPEEVYESPELYFDNVKPTSGMKNIQRKLTLELLSLMKIKGERFIDLGCGYGFSSELLKELGYEVVGIDISEKMVEHTREKGIKAVKGDFCELKKYFAEEEFDNGISISSLQWISKDKKRLESFADGVSYIIKYGLGIQFYPKDDKELKMVLSAMKKYFKKVDLYIIAHGTKKERIYIISYKDL